MKPVSLSIQNATRTIPNTQPKHQAVLIKDRTPHLVGPLSEETIPGIGHELENCLLVGLSVARLAGSCLSMGNKEPVAESRYERGSNCCKGLLEEHLA